MRPNEPHQKSAPAPTSYSDEAAVLKKARPMHSGDFRRFRRTRFGVYELNTDFENEMTNIEECDGSFIQKIRQYKKVSLEQLADATRISKSNLNALESNGYEALPAPVFVRGFVLQVARTLAFPIASRMLT